MTTFRNKVDNDLNYSFAPMLAEEALEDKVIFERRRDEDSQRAADRLQRIQDEKAAKKLLDQSVLDVQKVFDTASDELRSSHAAIQNLKARSKSGGIGVAHAEAELAKLQRNLGNEYAAKESARQSKLDAKARQKEAKGQRTSAAEADKEEDKALEKARCMEDASTQARREERRKSARESAAAAVAAYVDRLKADEASTMQALQAEWQLKKRVVATHLPRKNASQISGCLSHFDPCMRRHEQVVLEAVKTCGTDLQFAASPLRGKKEIVLAAAHQNGSAVAFASPELKADVEVCIAAAQQGRKDSSSAPCRAGPPAKACPQGVSVLSAAGLAAAELDVQSGQTATAQLGTQAGKRTASAKQGGKTRSSAKASGPAEPRAKKARPHDDWRTEHQAYATRKAAFQALIAFCTAPFHDSSRYVPTVGFD